MLQSLKLLSPVLGILLLLSCNNNDQGGAYADILSKPPYRTLTDSIKKMPSNSDLYYRRGMLLYKNSNYLPAREDFKKAWSQDKKEEYALALSNALLGNNDDSAVVFLNDALKVLPGSIPLQYHLASAYWGTKKIDDALRICNNILEKIPDQLDALVMKSGLMNDKGDTTTSIQLLEQAYHIAPYNEDICYDLAFKYAQQKNAAVIKLCDSLTNADTVDRRAEPYYFKGVYYSNIHDNSKALAQYDKAIQYDYTFLDAYMDKGKILYDQKKYNDAISVFQLGLKVSSSYADAYFWLGKCQEALGQKDEAKLNYLRAYGLDKTLTDAKEAADKL